MTEIEVRVWDKLAKSISELAGAVNRLAATQEKPVISQQKGKPTFGTATFQHEDPQARELREIERERSGDGGEAS